MRKNNSTLEELMNKHFESKNDIHEYFGYVPNWVEIPLEDNTEVYWYFDGNKISFAEESVDFEDGSYFEHTLYKQRFLNKWVYETKDYTMICMDTHTDGNKFLGVFDNAKKVTDRKIIDSIKYG